jgi:hypothetical protein
MTDAERDVRVTCWVTVANRQILAGRMTLTSLSIS